MRGIIIVLLFFFVFPIFPRFLPIPTDRVIELLGLAYFLIGMKKHLTFLSNRYILKVLGFSFVFFVLAFLAQFNNDNGFETAIIKNSIDIILTIFGAFFICNLIRRHVKEYSIIVVLEYFGFVFVLQAIISLVFYFSPLLYDLYISLLNTDVSQNTYDRLYLSEIRLMGVGNGFFNGVTKYGINLIILTFLRYNNQSVLFRKLFLFLLFYILFAIVGVMTGRTFFIAIGISLIVIMLNESYRIDKMLIRIIIIPIILLLAFLPFYLVFKSFVDSDRLQKTLNFVLELFNTYEETGSLTTNSSNKTLEMYVLPDNLWTWLFGDGKFINFDGSYYKHTDVGFLRYIYYFGIIGTGIYFTIQYKILTYITKIRRRNDLKFMFITIFLWIVILNFKGIAYIDFFAVFFLVAVLVEKQNKVICTT